ncbi:HAMP domain-containing protein [Candidatus Omnitrophota bacterium]
MDIKRTFNRRRIYFIEKSFQTKFILKFCALVALGGLLTTAIIYLLAMHSTTVSIINSRVVVRSTADFMLPVLTQTVLVVMILVSAATVLVTLFVSHKIAGPLFHFKKTMRALESGDFSSEFSLRELDQLKELAESFDAMIKKIKAQLVMLKECQAKLSGSHSEQELKQAIAELKSILDYFKT